MLNWVKTLGIFCPCPFRNLCWWFEMAIGLFVMEKCLFGHFETFIGFETAWPFRNLVSKGELYYKLAPCTMSLIQHLSIFYKEFPGVYTMLDLIHSIHYNVHIVKKTCYDIYDFRACPSGRYTVQSIDVLLNRRDYGHRCSYACNIIPIKLDTTFKVYIQVMLI